LEAAMTGLQEHIGWSEIALRLTLTVVARTPALCDALADEERVVKVEWRH
jgi:hypothetical protein